MTSHMNQRHILDILDLIDDGDDDSLPILADALEEAGDGRAAGLRELTGKRRYIPLLCSNGYFDQWGWYGVSVRTSSEHVPWEVWLKLDGGTGQAGNQKRYGCRSAAYLALAAALI